MGDSDSLPMDGEHAKLTAYVHSGPEFVSAGRLASFWMLLGGALLCASCHKQPVIWQQSHIRVADPLVSRQILYGFYDAAGNDWRWTGPAFSVALKPPIVEADKGARLRVQLYFPPAEIKQLGPITLSAETVDYKYNQVTYEEGGPHEFWADVPPAALCTNVLPITFFVDKYLKGSKSDSRDLGVVVTSITLSRTP